MMTLSQRLLEQNESASNNQQLSQNTSSFRNFKIEVDL